MWYPFILSVNIHDIIFHGWIKFQCLTKPHSILPIVYCQAFGLSQNLAIINRAAGNFLRPLQWASDPLSQEGEREQWVICWSGLPPPTPHLVPIPGDTQSSGVRLAEPTVRTLDSRGSAPLPEEVSEPFRTHIIRCEGPETRTALAKIGKLVKEVLAHFQFPLKCSPSLVLSSPHKKQLPRAPACSPQLIP